MIAIHAMMYRFQCRTHWQLSSLLEQRPWGDIPVPEFKYVMSTKADDPFAENTKALLKAFSPKLNIEVQEWPADDLTYGLRGHVRKQNLLKETAEFILFTDSDMVWHPEYMAKVGVWAERHRGDHRVVAAPRHSMSQGAGYSLIELARADCAGYTEPLKNAWDRAHTVKTRWSAAGFISGAGFFQLIHVPSVREYMMKTYGEVFYNKPNRDGADTNILNANRNEMRSDRSFRIAVEGIIKAPDLSEALHINHYRHSDPEWSSHPLH